MTLKIPYKCSCRSNKPHHAKGMCRKCYDRFRRAKKIDVKPSQKPKKLKNKEKLCICCGDTCYAKNLCRNHYTMSLRKGVAEYNFGYEDMVGRKFNFLTIERVLENKGKKLVVCSCKCGNECTKALSQVVSGIIKSCGCLRKQARFSFSIKDDK